MDSEIDSLMIDVRASTEGFAADVQQMRTQFDATLVDGFSRAGNVLESSLLGALRRGSLGFDDLKRTALRVLDEIASAALRGGIAELGGLFGGGGGIGGLIGGLLGLPGRATGGNVSPGGAYIVGERGPELFVPTSAGRVEAGGGGVRDVRVSINLHAPQGSSAAESLQRSSRQVASAVRRALAER